MNEEELKKLRADDVVYNSTNVLTTHLGSFGGMHDSIPTPTYYNNDYEKLLDQISPLCLPDQADKVIVKMLDIIKGYDADDTHRHTTDLLMQIARKHVGL
jgi:hypothetical protein